MKIDYGKEGLDINLDPKWNITILCASEQKSIESPKVKIKESINNPIEGPSLKEIIDKKVNLNSVCIVSSDATRPVPSNLILEAIVEELNLNGIDDNKISVLIATGLHRTSRDDELERILGKTLINRITIIDHKATDMDSLVYIGKSADNDPIFVNRYYYSADLKILTGYVEPHFFFGFSGGRKSLVPGIVGIDTIQVNHSAEKIASPYARFGIYKENPLHKHSLAISKKIGVDFIINVCINKKHEIIEIASGDFIKAHEKLVDYQLKQTFTGIKERYDVVICGNGGYPLDLNLYQAVKSMAIGELAVKDGGTIIAVNECVEGIGIGQDKFKELIFSGMVPKEIYKKILNKEIVVPDQWEIQILARILMKADVFIISELNENEIGNIGLKYAKNVEDAIRTCLKKYGSDASILILPNGPQLLPLYKK
ncbi:MAG: nickel-dependent lactate racemase [Promethearchaeota archaeon]|nr:MAG: nickel-dependent lactate racemase [Candidatus Lokiarchaeota archaeon]